MKFDLVNRKSTSVGDNCKPWVTAPGQAQSQLCTNTVKVCATQILSIQIRGHYGKNDAQEIQFMNFSYFSQESIL